ncbi:MAG: hypothetical protein ACKVZ0_25020 [Gemmatimonadales bacterium]
MWFKHRGWIPVAWLLSAVNLGAIWFAARPGETWHATGHGVLGVLFALGARHLMTRHHAEQLQQVLDQNEQLQETIDGMQPHLQELEERVDFAERLLAQHQERDRLGESPRGR